MKTFFQASNIRPVGTGGRTVFAVRSQVGLAHGFPRAVNGFDIEGNPTVTTVQALPLSQRFFAGGSTTVRGFQSDRLGTFDPDCANCSVIDRTTGLSLGGNGVVVMNAELRRVIAKLAGQNFAVATFLDAGNVFVNASDLDRRGTGGAAGLWVCWNSPLGPLRLDFGFKLDRLEIAERPESAWDDHLSIGEAF